MDIKAYFAEVSQRMDELSDEEFLALLLKVGLASCPSDPSIYVAKHQYNFKNLNVDTVSMKMDTIELKKYSPKKSNVTYSDSELTDNKFSFREVA